MKKEGSGKKAEQDAQTAKTGEFVARRGFVEPTEEELAAAEVEGRAVLPEVKGKALRAIRAVSPVAREDAEDVTPIVSFDPPPVEPETGEGVENSA